MIIPEGIERCKCGHNILLHYLEKNSDEHAGCIISDCKCVKYRAGEPEPPTRKEKS